MKRKTRKLKLDKQTVRRLGKLEGDKLADVRGGTFIPDHGFTLGRHNCGDQ